jgi:hypothetical protein
VVEEAAAVNVTALTWPCHDLPVAWRPSVAALLPFPVIVAPAIRPDAFAVGYGIEASFVVLPDQPGVRHA